MTKTVAVIAADGRTGRAFVAAALDSGMIVRAGYHSSCDVLPSDEHLTAVQCDATSESDVRTLLNGADVVVSLVGHVKNSPASVQTDSIKTIAKVMKEYGLRRIISLTGTGVRLKGDTPSFIDKVLNICIRLVDPHRINDGVEHVKFLMSSNLNWTIIRVLKLTNGTSQGTVKFSLHGPAELLTSRVRVAHGIVQIINNDLYNQQAPIVQGEL